MYKRIWIARLWHIEKLTRVQSLTPHKFPKSHALRRDELERNERKKRGSMGIFITGSEEPSNELYQIHDDKLKSEFQSGRAGWFRGGPTVRPGDIKGRPSYRGRPMTLKVLVRGRPGSRRRRFHRREATPGRLAPRRPWLKLLPDPKSTRRANKG